MKEELKKFAQENDFRVIQFPTAKELKAMRKEKLAQRKEKELKIREAQKAYFAKVA